jgi:hypothetical protein
MKGRMGDWGNGRMGNGRMGDWENRRLGDKKPSKNAGLTGK